MLIPLESWNRERYERFKAQTQWIESHLTGLACPRCQTELWLKDPMLVVGDMKASPAMRDVYCPGCHFLGVRLD